MRNALRKIGKYLTPQREVGYSLRVHETKKAERMRALRRAEEQYFYGS